MDNQSENDFSNNFSSNLNQELDEDLMKNDKFTSDAKFSPSLGIDYYSILNLPRNATPTEVRRAYLQLRLEREH
jgi:hypothetical protein